jgi:tetraacyldisaccharide 4'-kinase
MGDGVIPRGLAFMYGCVGFLRNRFYDLVPSLSYDIGKPVISIGGIHAGGTGKTPLCRLVARHFVNAGASVAFLSRGYGRPTKALVICKPGESTTWDVVGDEPAMLHDALPQTWLGVCANRRKTARLLCNIVPQDTVFVLDDGFQHRQISRSMNIVCLPPDPFSDLLLPAGSLREPLVNCERAQCICIIGSREQMDLCTRSRERLAELFPGKPIFTLQQVPVSWRNLATGQTVERPPVAKALMLSGIARPERFGNILSNMGISVAASYVFDDHHVFTQKEIQDLRGERFDGIVTTEKDAMRLRTIKLVNDLDIWYLTIDLSFFGSTTAEQFFENLNNSIGSCNLKGRYPA